MSQFVKIAGIIALSAAAAAGTSLWASDARADDEDNATMANNDTTANEDNAIEGNTAESSDPFIGWRGGWWGGGWRGGWWGGGWRGGWWGGGWRGGWWGPGWRGGWWGGGWRGGW